jgi:hypothetical protein
MLTSTVLRAGVFFLLFASFAGSSHAQTMRLVPNRKAIPAPPPAGPPAATPTLTCPAVSVGRVGTTYDSDNPALTVTVSGGTPPYTFTATHLPQGLTAPTATDDKIKGTPTSAGTYKTDITVTDAATHPASATCAIVIAPPSCWLAPTRFECMGDPTVRQADINTFFNTAGTLSYLNQIKSIYNGASSSATVSADLASLNFTNGMQVTVGTNIQAGSSNAATVSTGTVPTLSATSAGQATQNILYGGTIFASGLYPLLATGAASIGSPGGLGILVDFLVKEGIDIQSFKSGTSINVNNPTSHSSAQVEGYLQYNSTNLAPGSSSLFAGAVFVGGSYGYSYTSHDYARDYGFGNNVNNGIGQASAGILINNVAKIALSRAFGPSQTYIDSTSMAQTTVNNFKSWSFGITYQTPPPAPK